MTTAEANLADVSAEKKFHGKYVLLTSLDENDEVNVWKFYNVIRTVEETFHTLKTDLDMRPVFHKSDGGIKAHLNLAVLTQKHLQKIRLLKTKELCRI